MPECPTGKITYRSAPLAVAALRGIHKRHRSPTRRGPVESYYYRCPICYHYHLSRPQRKRLR